MAEHGGVFRTWGKGNADAVDTAGNEIKGYGRDLIRRVLSLPSDPENRPWQSMESYPREVAGLDIGIAPLADTAFNRAKSWLKPLEYAALGVPCVMSPTEEYLRINAMGVGVVAMRRSRAWKREVGRLLADDAHRAEVADRGREVVRERLLIEDNCWKWAEAWTEAMVRV